MGPDSGKDPMSTSYHLPMPSLVPSPDLSGPARSLGGTSQGSLDKGQVCKVVLEKLGGPPQRGGRRGPGTQVQEDVGVWEEDVAVEQEGAGWGTPAQPRLAWAHRLTFCDGGDS